VKAGRRATMIQKRITTVTIAEIERQNINSAMRKATILPIKFS
jgi:hypothetical protein